MKKISGVHFEQPKEEEQKSKFSPSPIKQISEVNQSSESKKSVDSKFKPDKVKKKEEKLDALKVVESPVE